MVAANDCSDTMLVESMELNELNKSNGIKSSEVDEAGEESHWEPEVDVMYDVDESPPLSLCLLLGFQVSVGFLWTLLLLLEVYNIT